MGSQSRRFLVRPPSTSVKASGGLGMTVALLVAGVIATAAVEKIVWKPVTLALLKVDDRQAKFWNVYVAHKKENLVLVQLGRRNLVLDPELREVVEIPPAALHRKGKDLEWDRAEKHPTEGTEAQRTQRENAEKNAEREDGAPSEKVLATADWRIRDAGRVRIIRVRLTDEGRVLEVQLPLRPDLRILY